MFQDSEFPTDGAINPYQNRDIPLAANLRTAEGFRPSVTIKAHKLAVSG